VSTGPLWTVLPDRWAAAQVKNLATVTLGKMLQSVDFGDDLEAPYLRAANVQPDGILDLEDSQTMWFGRAELSSLNILQGDVVVVEGGQGGFGRAAYVARDLDGWGFQNSINRLRPVADTDGRYLAYYLIALRSSGYLRAYCNVVSMPHLTAEKLSAVQIPVPPPDEQHAIADSLDSETARIDTLIEEQRRLIGMLADRKRAVLDSVVTHGLHAAVQLVDSKVDWLGPVPAHWQVKPLWSMFERIKDVGHPDEQMLSVFRDHGVIAKDSRDNINKTAENRNIYQLVHPGWLVTNRMKAWQGSVGISDLRGIVSGHYICFAPLHKEDDRYLNWLFRSPRYAVGYGLISRGVRIGQAEIDNDDYRLMPVVLPPLTEQRAIADYLDEQTAKIDGLIAETERFIELARERRSALITAAVTGQIELRSTERMQVA
jgi:type I restriction enzyme S subunit